MADVHSAEIRSKNMAAIKSKDTKPEQFIRSLLHRNGFRFRKNVSALPGSPDIVFRKYKAVIFINGCFWHGHDRSCFRLPKTRTEFWKEKICRNKQRDEKNADELTRMGWRTLTIWACAINGKERLQPEELYERTMSWLISSDESTSISGRSK